MNDLLRDKVLFLVASAHQLPIASGSVAMAVTSPPYWGPRQYDAPNMVFGGDPGCDHDFDVKVYDLFEGTSEFDAPNKVKGSTIGAHRGQTHMRTLKNIQSGVCVKCGAWIGQFGLEQRHDCLGWATGQMCNVCYVCHARMTFREIKRVLRQDGTFWLNIGDRYNGAARKCGSKGAEHGQTLENNRVFDAMPRKNLLLTPMHLALALQADGWIIRNDIAWRKPNAVPGPEEDRVVPSYEHVILAAPQPKYFFDYHPLMEPSAEEGYRRGRDVWDINTEGFNEAHFATFPEELPRRAIRAGASLWTCEVCGSPAYTYMEEDQKKGRKNIGGFRPTCKCGARGAQMLYGKAVVLDPFGGAGTTALAAVRLGRKAVSVDISPTYIEMQRRRLYRELLGAEPPASKHENVDWSGTLFEGESVWKS